MSVIVLHTQRKLCELLLHLAQVETSAEVIRQLLCEFEQFHPYVLFKQLDGISGKSKGKLTADDILLLLEANGFVHNIRECVQLIELFDQDDKQALYYSEFLRLTLPLNNPELRQQITLKRPDSTMKIHPQVDYTIAKLLNLEIKMLQECAYYVQELENCHDYNPSACFKVIDKFQTGRLLASDFKQLFQQCGVVAHDAEIAALFRRIDQQNDGVVDWVEFRKILFKRGAAAIKKPETPLKNTSYLKRYLDSTSNKKSPIHLLKSAMQKKVVTTPTKISRSVSHAESKFTTKKSYATEQSFEFRTPKKYAEQKTEIRAQMELSKLKNNKNKSTEKKQFTLLIEPTKNVQKVNKTAKFNCVGKSEMISGILIEIIQKLKEFEILRVQLATQPQFNLCDVFRFLDDKKLGYLTVENLEKYVSRNQLSALFRQQPQSKVRFTNFIEWLEPTDQDYAQFLHKKEAINSKDPLRGVTGQLFRNLLISLNELEIYLEQMKGKINIRDNFRMVDISNDQMISLKDLDQFLYQQGHEPDIQDIERLLTKFDYDRDGQISLDDFSRIFR